MVRKRLVAFGLICVIIFSSGCMPVSLLSNSKGTNSNRTTVRLSDGMYTVLATSVGGEARSWYIFGLSTGNHTAALIRVAGDASLREAALRNLWDNFEREHGAVAERRLALINIRQDVRALNTLLVTRPVISVHADVIEFGDPSSASSR